MTLRRQLLIVSLLLLCLPWAGCQFIREMEGALRKGQEQSLQATAGAIAAVLSEKNQFIYPYSARRDAPPDERSSVYAITTDTPVIVDGYDDGWENIAVTKLQSEAGNGVVYAAQVRGEYLYLLFHVQDEQIVYHNPGLSAEPNGDRLVLRMWHNQRRQDYVIATAAPGSVRAKPGNRRERDMDASRIRGYWQDAVGGYTLELEIPMDYTGGRLGFFFVNEAMMANKPATTVGTIEPLHAVAPPWLIHSPEQTQRLLRPFSNQNSHIQVVDQEQWLLADQTSGASSTNSNEDTFWLLRLLYRSILSQDSLQTPPEAPRLGKIEGEEIRTALQGTAANTRYRDGQYRTRTLLSAAAPIADADGILGAVIVRQSGETYLSLTDKAFSRLLSYSLLALAIGAAGLLGYASMLSWRIRKLSQATHEAIGDDGRVTGNFTRSTAKDEIGDLSRQYGNLLVRVREYNDYLRTLSRKLSHELRTPIAVIQSSLDNLEQSTDQEAEQTVYLRRARQGLARLQQILTAMSEANRLEESIGNNTAERVDLVPLLKEIHAAYRDIYQGHRLLLAMEHESAVVIGAPDLIVQCLDKLMDNAASFCPADGEITLQLAPTPGHWEIRISNEGPVLPEAIRENLFEPMVSLREEKSESVHLGLGLHVVRLIAEFHRGKVTAENLPEADGVVISIRLPMAEPDAQNVMEASSKTPAV